MASSSSLAAVRAFVALVTEGNPPSVEELIRALDELASAYHAAPPGNPSDSDAESPPNEYEARYAAFSDRFPELGYYSSTDPSEPLSDALTGDAIDDLADIVGDLLEVLWHEKALGADDAHWHLRSLFAMHWGRHLRDLSLCLHVKQFG